MSPYVKTILRSIKMTFPRFIAIFAIIALGVGFFAGLKVTTPSFVYTSDVYVNEYALFDFRFISTIGFTEEDIDELGKQTGCIVEGAYFADCSAVLGDKASSDTVHFISITKDVNKLRLESGRLPSKADEIVVDAYQLPNVEPGTKLVVTEETSDSSLKMFKYREYTVVGTARSPLFMNFQRGTSNEGSGSISYYVCALPEAFDSEYYTEAYLFADTGLYIYSDEYKEWADAAERQYKVTLDSVINDRFESMIRDEYDKLYDGVEEFNDGIDDAWSEISDGQEELDEAKKKLDDAQAEIDKNRTELDKGKKTLDDTKKQLDSAYKQLTSTKVDLDAAKQRVERANSELESMKEGIDSLYDEISDDRAELSSDKSATQSRISALKFSIGTYESLLASIDSRVAELNDDLSQAQTEEEKASIQSQIDTQTKLRDNYQSSLDSAKAEMEELNAKSSEYEERAKAIDEKQKTYEDKIASYNVKYQSYLSDKLQYDLGLSSYESSKASYDSQYAQYSKGLAQYNDGAAKLDEAQQEVDDGWDEYNDGIYELWKGYSEYSDTADTLYNTELIYGFSILDGVEDPDIYVLGRDKNTGYVCFDNDSKIVDGVAKVFPVFFFAIAALVCSTTMSRMIADERGIIGTMRALGYSDTSIVMKYVIYSGSASVLGCVLGFLGGTKLFPWVIWEAYKMMYGFADLRFTTSILLFIIALCVSLICTVGVTIVSCMSSFTGMPAELIRPKAPLPGKRILLEYIGFIWKRMKFLYKVSTRNVFRFKKRMFMMIVGISGCTALLITAFGLNDSVCDVVNLQYDTIMKYDLSVSFDSKYRQYEIENAAKAVKEQLGVDIESAVVKVDTAKNNGSGYVRDLEMIVSDDPNINTLFGLTDYKTGEELVWPSDGEIAISGKLAEKNDIKVGDSITFLYGDDEHEVSLKVSEIFANYTFHYALMTPNTYRDVIGEPYTPETLLIGTENTEDAFSIASNLSDNYTIKTWSATSDSRDSFTETMARMNYVIILVIVCAAALAFIVLFNLNNINITERIREIATLKVMGFNRGETGAYVTRENVILVLMGFVAGIPLGFLLHRYVMNQIAMDMVTYQMQIRPLSYVYALGFVLVFSAVVNIIMRARIEKINMAESLKSAE